MSEILGEILQVGFFAAVIRIATPLILATVGEMFTERGGVLNLGIEGIMRMRTEEPYRAPIRIPTIGRYRSLKRSMRTR